MAKYANIIIDISSEKLDKTFQYLVPEHLQEQIQEGMQVSIPFGKRQITGYVVELTDQAEYDVAKLRPIDGVVSDSIPIESQMIALAGWMRRNYGATMNQALKTVIPVKQKSGAIEKKRVRLLLDGIEAKNLLGEFERKHNTARAKLLAALIQQPEMEWELITQKLGVSSSVIRAMETKGIVEITSRVSYRNPIEHFNQAGYHMTLNLEQQAVVDEIWMDYQEGIRKTYLLKGVTGSGKTEVYMELIAHVLENKQQAIVLIPEIALTFQTVMRFYNRFGDCVSIMNSKLSQGERYDQFLRAKNNEIQIMIGPRSALFTPFEHLGLIIIDEEHEASYKSETLPRYHARETAIARAKMANASVVLGSATPSVDSYYHAQKGEYQLLEMHHRVNEAYGSQGEKDSTLPVCHVVDLREELQRGNRSILSARLQELMEERLAQGQQTMLFINRRGVAGFVSCRACGYVVKCPHCDVSLSQHNNGKMICHYCGYEEPVPRVCPACGSKYISGFKAGTQKIEEVVQQRFPQARVLRMDTDTTRNKDGYEKILAAFSNQEADILVGTQMIVKGHDFPNVTLVGVLAADLSLHVSDYHASERTFQLLTQAAGRAGRGSIPGEVVIQTYSPEHFSIATAQKQDYESFYQQEIAFRKMLFYPPVWNMLQILCASREEQKALWGANMLVDALKQMETPKTGIIGPSDAAVAKVNDIYKKVIYIKTEKYGTLVTMKDTLEALIRNNPVYKDVSVQFDFNPMQGF